MNGKTIGRRHGTWWLLATALLVLLIVLSALPPVPVLAQGGPDTMNFQGRLLDASGNPRGGEPHCMSFRLCSDADCATPVWPSSIDYEYHVVTTESGTHKAGLFTVTLGDSAGYTSYPLPPALFFDHDTLYLEIGVSDSSSACDSASYTTMTPRSQLRANAYAQRSRRVHTEESSDSPLVFVQNTGQGQGVYAEVGSTSGATAAGHFYAAGTSGQTYGVRAQNDSTGSNAAAGYFHAAGSSGDTYGVYARNDSTTHYATAGRFYAAGTEGQTYGVWVENESTADDAAAGNFYAYGDSGRTYGVAAGNNSTSSNAAAGLFHAYGSTGQTYGVRAQNDSTGSNAAAGYFHAAGSSGDTYGVYARNDSTSDNARAGYFYSSGTTGMTSGIRAEVYSNDGGAIAGEFYANGLSGLTVGVGAWNKSTTNGACAGLFVTSGHSGATRAVEAVNYSSDDDAVAGYFHAAGLLGQNYAVYAQNDSSSYAAMAGHFLASGTSGQTYGVYAQNDSTTDDAAAGTFYASGTSGQTYAVQAQNDSTTDNAVAGFFYATGAAGRTYGAFGRSDSPTGHGGHFVNLDTTSSSGSQVGLWAGSYYANVIEGHDLNPDGSSANRVFYVDRQGYVYADGSYNCGLSSGCFNTGIGADVAERIDPSEILEPGDVVEIDPKNPRQFRLSRSAYSTLVAGVVSTNPAITMNNNDLADNDTGERTDKRPLLALAGQVPVKVSAENGPIRPGDLLVASTTPGHAMRADSDAPQGTVIGKALEGLESGTGVILMLAMLQ